MKKIFLSLIRFYQRFISAFSYGSCRYYPTCSEYAKWQMMHNNFFKALLASCLRILRCNQLFAGGIEYPIMSKKIKKTSLIYTFKRYDGDIKFWFVPCKKGGFYIIKHINFTQ